MASENDFLSHTLEEFIRQVPSQPPSKPSPRSTSKPWVVLLTGSTGSLGSHILPTLQNLPPQFVRKIYCLNRPRKDGSFLLSPEPARIVFLEALFDAHMFGLGEDSYRVLLEEVTIIIHNAWTVDWLLSGEKFRPQLAGVRNFLSFAHQSESHPPVLFISSLGIAYALGKHHIEEEICRDVDLRGGYWQSKYVAERMLEAYALSTGLPAAVVRVGQLAGPVDHSGIWPPREWFPTLLRASKHLGFLPQTMGKHENVDWIPVDIAPQIILEIAEYVIRHSTTEMTQLSVFNFVNPNTVPFTELVPHLADISNKVLPDLEWLALLEDSISEKRIPGQKLLSFYKAIFAPGKPRIETCTSNLTKASSTARDLLPVNKDWILRWLDQWGFHAPSSHL